MALGLENAGFLAVGLAEIDRHACATLRANRPRWNVLEADVRRLDTSSFGGVELFAGGVPCPPFSVAGKQLGADDDRAWRRPASAGTVFSNTEMSLNRGSCER